jgi:hypothetical protein
LDALIIRQGLGQEVVDQAKDRRCRSNSGAERVETRGWTAVAGVVESSLMNNQTLQDCRRTPERGWGLHGRSVLALLTAAAWSIAALAAADFNVSNSGSSSYVINGQPDPELTLTRGQTYSFAVTAAGHPFWIKTAAVTGTGSAFNDGVSGNGTQLGTLTFTVPTDAPDTLFYICQIHSAMRGTINIVNPILPPAVNILSIAVTANVTVQSTGADGWNVTPEFATDLSEPAWTPIIGFENAFAAGTNTTTFNLIGSGNPILIRIRLDQN